MTSIKNFVIAIVIYLLWFAAVFDPIGNIYYLRYIALVTSVSSITLFGYYMEIFNPKPSFKNIFIIYVAFLMPIYGLILCLLRGGLNYEFLDTSYIAAGLLLILSVIYASELYIKYGLGAMVFSLRSLTILIIFIYIAMAIDVKNVNWFSLFTVGRVALLGFRDYAGIPFPYIYFLASPVLVFLICYDLNKLFSNFKFRYIILSCMSLLAYGLSGTRSHLIISLIIGPLFYILLCSKHKLLFSLIFVAFFGVYVTSYGFHIVESFFSKEEASNAIKLAMLDGYSEIFDSPLTFFFGQGYNARWSPPLMDMIGVDASKTELTYLELFRVYGLFIAIPFYILLLTLFYRLSTMSRDYKWLIPALFVFLLDSALNPYIFSTNGMLPLGLIISIISIKSAIKPDQYYCDQYCLKNG